MVNSIENLSPIRANDYKSLTKIYHDIKPILHENNQKKLTEKLTKTTF